MLLYWCKIKINFSNLRGRGRWSESSFFCTTLIISSLAWTIFSTVLQLDLTATTNVTAASNKSASLVIGKQNLSTLTHAVGQLVANQSSPSRVTPHLWLFLFTPITATNRDWKGGQGICTFKMCKISEDAFFQKAPYFTEILMHISIYEIKRERK